MKTIYRTSVLFLFVLLGINASAANLFPARMLSVHVAVSAKAYWDGQTKSCLPREKGGCCHIWLEGMNPGPGEISGELVFVNGNTFQLTVSRGKGMTNETYLKYFSEGKFNQDGPVTFDPAVLSKLGIEASYVIPSGSYPATISGDLVTITFR
ncbi:MAG: hypothetical protein WCJ26_05085 [bacterium]